MINIEYVRKELHNITVIGSAKLNIKHTNKDMILDILYPQLTVKLENWLNQDDKNLLLKNMQSFPEYAFLHFLANKKHPSVFSEVACELKHDDSDFDYHDWYGELTHDIFNLELNEEITAAIDTSFAIEYFTKVPISEYTNIAEMMENMCFDEICDIANAILIATSVAESKKAM